VGSFRNVSVISDLKSKAWVRNVLAAWERLRVTNGNLYAAAITYFSFLALFPLLLLGVSIAGFFLNAHPAALQTLFDKIASNAPGGFGSTLHDSIDAAIKARTSIGIIGLLGVLLTGLGWIGNLRAAIDAVWEKPPAKENPVKQRVVNLLILGGLGLGLLASLGLTALWAAFTHTVLASVGLDHVPGMGTLLGVIGVGVTLAGDAVIFFLVLTRLPRTHVHTRIAVRGAIMAAVGFELLKIVGTYTIAATSGSATAGPFAAIVAVLIWIQLVTRWILFCTAWTAVRSIAATVPPPVLPSSASAVDSQPALSPAAVGAGLVGAGAVAGAAVTALALRRSRS
jgi:membrane protein